MCANSEGSGETARMLDKVISEKSAEIETCTLPVDYHIGNMRCQKGSSQMLYVSKL